MLKRIYIVFATILCGLIDSTTLADARSTDVGRCDSLASERVPHTTLEAQTVPAGPFSPATQIGSFNAPAFCRVKGLIQPVPGSRIGLELWMPRAAWNGRLKMLGNGGYSSALPLNEMGVQLKAGYAVVATDTGHEGDGPEFAIGRPESIIDWGHRSVHLTAVTAKQLVKAFYGREARYAYFQGCSTGGHQALMEAQRYPEDFDGIIAGAPGHNRTHLNAGFLWQFTQSRGVLPASKLPAIAKAAFEACRAQNGTTAGGLASDAYLNDPLACTFDPAVLRCGSTETPDCLSSAQVEALKRMYDGARNARTGARIYFGWPPGTESSPEGRRGWNLYWADPANPARPARAGFWQHWVFNDPQWDGQRFDFDRDMQRADEKLAPVINAMSADLERFRARGGKLIHYHGTADPVVPYADSISYHTRVVNEPLHRRGHASSASAAPGAGKFYRLFLAPGLGHCFGGAGPAPVNLQQALEEWVERGRPPEQLLATRSSGGVNNEAFSRPLCPYPQIARYDGRGPPNAASSFACVEPKRTPVLPAPAAEYLR